MAPRGMSWDAMNGGIVRIVDLDGDAARLELEPAGELGTSWTSTTSDLVSSQQVSGSCSDPRPDKRANALDRH